ncbi:MAG: carboxypeptidase regulatory-like domain-containing protein [Acidobacteriota bacterium]
MKLGFQFLNRIWLAAVLPMLFMSVPGQAQLVRGFISGTVTDPSNSVIVGAEVTIANKATNLETKAQTNEIGFYRFVAVEPGQYMITFSAPGFETVKVGNIQVATTQEVVVNQVLKLGPEATVVEVTDAPPGVELAKATATIDQKLDGKFVQEVAIVANTRDVTRLALLAPTVNRAPGSNEFAANGQRARNNNFLLDGTDNNDLSITLISNRIIPEGVAEFQVQTTSYSAEFGRNSGAQVSVITRSGTNVFHGEGWNFYRANWMEPLSLANKRSGISRTPWYVQNQGGGSMGGPIKKDRTFFFGLFEVNSRREKPDAGNATSANIPTPAGFAALQTVPLRDGQSVDSRQAVLKALGFLPEIHQQVTNYTNMRNVVINSVPIEVGNIRIPLANPHRFYYVQGRVDHRLTNNDSLSYRLQLDKRNQPDLVSNLAFGSKWSGAQTVYGQNHALSHTRNFGAHFINEFRGAYVRRNLNFPENDPVSSTVGITGFFTIGGSSNFPQGRIQNTYQFQDVATYISGRHSFKFGGDLRRNQLFSRSGFDSKGTWTFGSLADFLNNRATLLRQAVNEATFDARQTNQYYFFQDDFKVTRTLTLNLGLRYEFSGVPFGFFGAANDQIAAAGVPRNTRPDKNNWAPRLGFAYSPNGSGGVFGKLFGEGQSVIRGGFGVGYDVLFFNILSVNANNYPRVVNSDTTNPVDLFPTLAPKTPTLPPFNPLSGFVNAPVDTQNPTTHFWSLSFQRQFRSSYVFELGYTGNRSYHGIRQGQGNPPILTSQQAATVIATRNPNSIPTAQQRRVNPAWGSRTLIEATALGEYHAMVLRFDRRFSRGLVVGSNYTWSSNFSDNDESLAVSDITLSSPQVPQDYFNFRNEWSRSVFDRPHRFVVHYLYEIPWSAANFSRHILGGWQVAGFTEWQSGQPFTIRTGVDSVGTAAGGTNPPGRPNYNAGGILTRDPVEGNFRTFSTPIDGTGIVVAPLTAGGIPLANSMPGGGSLGRNTFRGPSFSQWNFTLMKTVPLWERVKLQLRSDLVNLWNHNNFQNPEGRMNSPTFGANTATLISDSRTMLVSAKIRF